MTVRIRSTITGTSTWHWLRVGAAWAALAVLLCGGMPAHAQEAADSVQYQVRWVNQTRVHVITVDLTDHRLLVTPALAHGMPGKRQSFVGFLADHQPLAQVTGSYFSLQSALPIGDVVIDGKMRYDGYVGSALALRADNSAEIMNIPVGWRYSWPGYESVLQGGMRLVQNGKYAVYPRAYGFRDPGLFRHATRTAVGLTAEGRLLLVGVNKEILLSDLAGIMKALGCRDAMTLDGGTSTGLAFGSQTLIMPGRTLSNVLIVTVRPEAPVPTPAPAPVPAAGPTETSALPAELPAEGFGMPDPLPSEQAPALDSETTLTVSSLQSSLANPPQFRYSNALASSTRDDRSLSWVFLVVSIPSGPLLALRRLRRALRPAAHATARA